jgi:hypothetical protein
MSFIYFIKLLLKNLLWLILIPTVVAGSIFYFTRNEQKIYSSESVVYTGIASGYNLSGSNKSDYFATSNAFDNLLSLINSRETKQEVLINLLAGHLLLKKQDPLILSQDAFNQLQLLVPDSIRSVLVKPTLEGTILSLNQYMKKGEGNVIYSIIHSDNPFYSLNAMNSIKASRINNSDLIKIAYETSDAAICMRSLELLEESFMKKHRMIKEGQSETVVGYFEEQTHNALSRLNAAEESFMEFNKQHDIINYYEQTKAVAVQKENLGVQEHNLVMDKMASIKSLEKVNDNLKNRLYQNEYGADIINKRAQLSDLNNTIAVGEFFNKNEKGNLHVLDSLRNESAQLDKKMKGSVYDLYSHSLTPNGIPNKFVLDEWIKTSLDVEQNKARLTAMDKRRIEFSQEYRKYAPLGALLKKIERLINVSEQEYLEMLHGLNTAKLTQQNTELTTKLNIVDPPFLPLKANASKRIVLVIVGFMVGFILVLSIILARVLINQTLQRPDRAASLTGLPMLGIYPLLSAPVAFIQKSNLRLLQQLLPLLNFSKKPVTIGFFSIQEQEGKSTLINALSNDFSKLNYTVETLQWNEGVIDFSSSKDIVLLEFPPLDSMMLRPGLIPPMDHSILVCRANRVWGKIDKNLLSLFVKSTCLTLSFLLNGVKIDFAEEYIGETQKKRFFLRSYLKGLAKFEFGNKKNIRA